MTTLAIRKKLADYMHIADDKKVKAIYALLETDLIEQTNINLEQYNEELETADKEIAKGNFMEHKEEVKRFNNRKVAKI